MNNRNGKIAIKKLKAIPPALVVNAPLTMPMMYISKTSYNDKPCNPGIFIFFPQATNRFSSGIFSKRFSISFDILSFELESNRTRLNFLDISEN